MATTLTENQKMANSFEQVTKELSLESDRGAVILAFAWMDEQLTSLITKFCFPSIEKKDELFGTGKAIGDAATKINLAFRLGLINDKTHKSLHGFRKLRNDFAHLTTSLSFDDDSVRDRLKNIFELERMVLEALWESACTNEILQPHLKQHSGKSAISGLSDTMKPKALFCITAGIVVSGLALLCERTEQVHPQLF